MSSPCPPRSKACTSCTEQPISRARRNERKGARGYIEHARPGRGCAWWGSRWPSRLRRPSHRAGCSRRSWTRAPASAWRRFRRRFLDDAGVDVDQIVAAHAGLGGPTPAVDDDHVAAGGRLIRRRADDFCLSKPSMGEASYRSSALPWGHSFKLGEYQRGRCRPSSLAAAQCAAVAPTLPAPMMLIFARRMRVPFESSLRERGGDYGGKGRRIQSRTWESGIQILSGIETDYWAACFAPVGRISRRRSRRRGFGWGRRCRRGGCSGLGPRGMLLPRRNSEARIDSFVGLRGAEVRH